MTDGFAAKLALLLKALSVSRGRLAAELGVDKSVVSRWLSGSYRPSGENLSQLTRFVAARVPGFTGLDWDQPLDHLQGSLGRPAGSPADEAAASIAPSAVATWLTETRFGEAASATAITGRALTGYWRTTRPSPELAGRYLHDIIFLRPTDDGALATEVAMLGGRMKGWSICVGNQMFLCVSEVGSGITSFVIANHLGLSQIDIMDGTVMGAIRGGGGVPTATPIVLERLGHLSGDAAADTARFAAFAAAPPLAADGAVPEWIARHFATAMAAGGTALLAMPSLTSLAHLPPMKPSASS